MNENLTQLVKDSQDTGVLFSERDLDLPAEDLSTSEGEIIEVVEESQTNSIPIDMLSSWFETNGTIFGNINQVKADIRGIDCDKTLIITVKNEEGVLDENGHEERTLRVFDNADTIPVLDLPPLSMDIYNNGFKIVYQYGDIFIKTYGIRTGLICILCTSLEGKLIPYNIVRVKKKDTELDIDPTIPTITTEQLSASADLESLQLLYKQSAKSVEDMSTNQSVIDWLIDRQESVTDINHHLQIDNVLIDILK